MVDTVLTALVLLGRSEWSQLSLYPKYFLLLMLSPANVLTGDSDGWSVYLAAYLAEIGRVVLPVYLLGAFVFKLFNADPIEWRGKASLEDRVEDHSPALSVRFYNGTASPLVNVTIRAFARVQATGSPRVNYYIPLKIFQGGEDKEFAIWPFGRPGVPFTLHVPFGQGLSAAEVENGKDVVLPGRDRAISRDRVSLFCVVDGTSLETGAAFTSGREYRLADDLLIGHYAEIDANYDTPPQTWAGWEHFEMNRDFYVFGYATLASPESVAQTVGRSIDPSSFQYATLRGWSRRWSVASDRFTHPERRFYMPDGSEFTGTTVVMGIVRDSGATCDGAVFPVSRVDLSVLDVRERSYRRTDISNEVTWENKPAGSVVYTYVPTMASRNRVEDARSAGKAVAIRETYLNLVRSTFARLASKNGAHPEFADVPYRVLPIEIKVDPSFNPVGEDGPPPSYL